MVSNTDLFFKKIKDFQDAREMLTEKFQAGLQYLERYKGSEGYAADVKSLQEKYDNDLEDLRKEYRPSLLNICNTMRDVIGRRPIKTPTDEQLNLLNILRMKRRVRVDETDRIATSLEDCPIAMDVLQEISTEHGIMRSYTTRCKELSNVAALDIIDGMNEKIDDFLLHDSSRAARLASKYYDGLYGADPDRELAHRRMVTDKITCFEELAGINADLLNLFEKAVDA